MDDAGGAEWRCAGYTTRQGGRHVGPRGRAGDLRGDRGPGQDRNVPRAGGAGRARCAQRSGDRGVEEGLGPGAVPRLRGRLAQAQQHGPGHPGGGEDAQPAPYVDGDLGDDATYQAMSDMIGPGEQVLFYMEVPAFLFGRIAQGIATAGRARGARVMVEKPFGSDLASSQKLNDTMHKYFPED